MPCWNFSQIITLLYLLWNFSILGVPKPWHTRGLPPQGGISAEGHPLHNDNSNVKMLYITLYFKSVLLTDYSSQHSREVDKYYTTFTDGKTEAEISKLCWRAWHMAQLGKECVVVTDPWQPLPWLLSTTGTEAAGAAWKQVIGSWASLRLSFTSLTPDVVCCPSASTSLTRIFTRLHLWNRESGNVVGTDRGVGETGLGRRKQKKKQTSQRENKNKQDQLGSCPTERKATAERECHSIWRAQTSRNAIERVILSNDITEPLSLALPNIIIGSFWHSQEAGEPLLSPGPDQVLMWLIWHCGGCRLPTTQKHSLTMPPLFLCSLKKK